VSTDELVDRQDWYGVKCLVEHKGLSNDPKTRVYEERILVLRAPNFDEAILRAEREATQYAGQNNGLYIGYCNAYKIDSKTITEGTEVYSVMREVDLAPDQFIAHYYDDGSDKHH
jgi:hypothetical protein